MPAGNLNHFTKEYKHIIQRGVIMKTNFFIDCRWYTTPCKTVLNADRFIVEFLTSKHSITAKVSDKCYFLSIDNISLSDIKCDFNFSRNYSTPKEFLSNLYETFVSFLNTFISDEKCPLCKNTDEVLDRILEIVTATDPEVGEFVYEVDIHHFYGWDTYTVRADGWESAKDKALKIMKNETLDEDFRSIDSIRIYEEDSDELLKEIILEPTVAKDTTEKELIEPEDTHIDDIKKFKEKAVLNSSYGEATEPLTVNQFERLTRTLYKSLFKAIGLTETRKIPFIISNNMVFFNYNGIQYKYYPSQCKVFKKCGRKYQRINWKNFTDDNSPTDQKQAFGRSPPFTPDIRSSIINDLK